MRGTVKWFNDTRGFGVIEPKGRDQDVYVHFTNINTDGIRTLESGMTVEFELERRAEKYCAVDVTPEEPSSQRRTEWLG